MRGGFTLIELIVVIIIIGILATLGINQYGRMIEIARGAEARTISGHIRTQAAGYYLEYNDATEFNSVISGIGDGDDQIPAQCRSTHYFSYFVTAALDSVTVTATRCGTTGRGGASPAEGRQFILVTTFPSGTDIMTGSGGY